MSTPADDRERTPLGYHNFAAYQTWAEAEKRFAAIKPNERHVFEVIQAGRPCKPYLDLDGEADALPEGCDTVDAVVARTQALVRRVFADDYGADALDDDAFVWTHSPNQAKLSLHLVINTRAPQLVFRSNHQSDPHGAFHLAQRLRQLDPDGVGKLVDDAVYSKDREMRLMGSSKINKTQSVLVALRDGVTLKDAAITWEGETRLIEVPSHIPRQTAAAAAARTPRAAASTSRSSTAAAATSDDLDVELVDAILSLVPHDKVENYATWMRAGLALRRAGVEAFDGDADALFDSFDAFSRRCPSPKYPGPRALYKLWDGFGSATVADGDAVVRFATLCAWAKEARPEAFADAQRAFRARRGAAGRVAAPEGDAAARAGLLCKQLAERWPDLFADTLRPDTFAVTSDDGEGMLRFSDAAGALEGRVFADLSVHLDAHPRADVTTPRFVGELAPGLSVKELSRLHKDVHREAVFSYTRESPAFSKLMGASPHDATHIEIHHGAVPAVRVNSRDVRGKTNVDWLMQHIHQAALDHAATSLGLNVRELFAAVATRAIQDAEEARVRPDYDFGPALDEAGFTKQVVGVGDNAFYYALPDTGVWALGTINNAAGVLRELVARRRVPGLTDVECAYLKRCEGALKVVRSLTNQLQDRDFANKLNAAALPPGCLPFADGLFDAAAGTVRPFKLDDYVSRTVGYPLGALDDPVLAEQTAFVQDFYGKVFPVAEERDYFLWNVARALYGPGGDKEFMVLTDERDGYNGKTSVMRAVEDVFGDFAAPAPRGFLSQATHHDPNAHSANLLACKGARLAFFDEPGGEKIDLPRLKDLTSGESRQSGRACGSGAVERFKWRAFIVIACNESGFPTIDASDAAFLRRMKALRMRSLFVSEEEMPQFEGEEHVFAADTQISSRLFACRAAHARLLADAYRRGAVPEPRIVKQTTESILLCADPRLPIVVENIEKLVDFNPPRPESKKGCKYYAVLAEKDLVKTYIEMFGDAARHQAHGASRAVVKKLIERAMTLKGRKVNGRMQPVDEDTGKVYSVKGYDRVAFLMCDDPCVD